MIEHDDINRLLTEEFEHFKNAYTPETAVQAWAEDHNITSETMAGVIENLLSLVVADLKDIVSDEVGLKQFLEVIQHLSSMAFLAFVLGFKVNEQYGRVTAE